MEKEKRPGTGAIFKNEKKTSENHPDYRGIIVSPRGEEMQVSLWRLTSRSSGKMYFSVAATPPYKPNAAEASAASLAGTTRHA